MRAGHRPLLAPLIAGLLLLPGLGAAAPAGTEGRAASANGLIVKFRDSIEGTAESRARFEQELARAGLTSRRVGARARHIDFGRRLGHSEIAPLVEQLQASPHVEWVVPNEREQRLNVPQDPLFAASFAGSGQWWLFPAGGSNANDIEDRRRGVPGVQSAWQTTLGTGNAVIAVLDTGITAHPDLGAGVLPGRDFVSTVEYANDGDGWDADPADPGDWVSEADRSANAALFGDCEVADSSWHGTVIAGLLAAETSNARGVAAINWNGRVLPVRVAGKCGADVADIVTGMRWAAGLQVHDAGGRPVPLNPNPARVLNISFGGSAACNAAYQDVIDELAGLGVVVVAAAGNQNAGVSRPANCRGVIGVGALNRDGFKSSYSNFGEALTISTVGGDPRLIGDWGIALGDDALLTVSNSGTTGLGFAGYAREAGTSFATPLVAGVIGLMLSVEPSLSAAQIMEGLRRSARPHVVSTKIAACSPSNPGRCICTTETCGAGILDAEAALHFAANPTGYVAPARQPEVIDNIDVDDAVALGLDRPANAGAAPPAAGEDGGGGSLGAGWLLALAAAVAALSCRRPRSRGPAPANAMR
ncbi:MAG: S8 family peptidase [Piscinibacter sp.]|uniref:S8 family peptidase n=1 Tax=Piscinibacter sp. TaxID=1903157 RepID=UPI003D143ED1